MLTPFYRASRTPGTYLQDSLPYLLGAHSMGSSHYWSLWTKFVNKQQEKETTLIVFSFLRLASHGPNKKIREL